MLLFCFSDQYRLTSFTSLSVVVGRMVRAVHRCLLMVLSSESSAIVITQVLKCLATVIANVPYQRLRPGLLGSAVKQIRPYLTHRGKSNILSLSSDTLQVFITHFRGVCLSGKSVVEFDRCQENVRNWPKVRELSRKKSCQGKLFIVKFMFGALLNLCLAQHQF